MLSKMRVEELKSYLKIRRLKVSGKKEELVARVFVAFENNVQPSEVSSGGRGRPAIVLQE